MDQHQRHKALNPCQSFIVQAPAGSGKTELLTQRFLALLAKVSQPEEILALTFTRKAAQEMRHRILVALQEAQAKTPLHSSHQQLTRALALEALHRDKELDWHILNHPQRLKITTFDAYCLELYQSIPNSEQLTLSKLSDYPDWCYRQAIQNWFNWCKEHPSLQQHLKKLLRTVHNQPQKLFEELNTLLACRDQWLENLHLQAQKDETEHLMTLKTIILKHWQPWENALPKNLQEELVELIQSCLNYISEDDFPHLRTWHQFTHINTSQIQELAQILLTKDLEFRKVLNHHIGLTLDRGPKTKIKELQNTSQELLATLVEYSEFHQLLIQLPQFPDPNEVFLDWELLQAYYQLLPLLVAHLHLEFEAQTCSDFIYIAQQAQLALVDTDVSLYLEHQLHHLLIDEFQDTSWSQLKLVEQLIIDWEQSPDKTIFIVGDPMQSIYRFRSADVGIFLTIQRNGFRYLKPEALYLKQNFRTDPQIIHPLNQHFSEIFPKTPQIDLGGVPFHEAHPALESHEMSELQAFYYEDALQQTQKIIHIIQEAQQQEVKTLAILVKNRNQLSPILQALQSKKIPYQGLDLHPLGQLPHIRDVWNLTQLLINPEQSLPEYVVLRSPWVGLSLHELEQLANRNPKASLNSLIKDQELATRLSESSLQRLHYFAELLNKAKQAYHQYPLAKVLQEFLLALHAKQLLKPHELKDLDVFLSIIERFDKQFMLPDIQDIQQALDSHYISAHQAFELQIMTIHKSKGLEFDWVIIPNMGDAGRASPPKLINWYPFSKRSNDIMGMFIYRDPHCADEHYLNLYKWFDKQQQQFENQRLCYVALTRARSRLYVLDDKNKAQHGSFRSLFHPDFFIKPSECIQPLVPEAQTISWVQRLPLQTYCSSHTSIKQQEFVIPQAFTNSFYPKQIGIITHRLLQWICTHHPQQDTDIPWNIAQKLLAQFGSVEPHFSHIKKLIKQFWNCQIGRWIAHPHLQEHNEYSLLIKDQHIIRKAIIDRTFVDQNKRWIIDFKTDALEKNTKNQYRIQLNRYASYIHELHPHQEIACGLYHLNQQSWKTWDFIPQTTTEYSSLYLSTSD